MDTRFRLDYAEFYITNSCNFNCEGCNRFNNYAFKGWQAWQDYKEVYSRWSQLLDLPSITVLGGEPMMNPTLSEWLTGIRQLWPDSHIRLTTNGHFIDPQDRQFYDTVLTNNIEVSVGLHNRDRLQPMLQKISQWLCKDLTVVREPENIYQDETFQKNWQNSYASIKDDSWPICQTLEDWRALPDWIRIECQQQHNFDLESLADQRSGYKIVDSNGVVVVVLNENFFHQGAIIRTDDAIKLHNSDPTLAHEICHSKKCHHFIKGKLYKCGAVALFPQFDQQFGLDLSTQDRELMNSYQPGEVDKIDLRKFLESLDNPIPQCKFCPQQYHMQEIHAQHGKKIKIVRRKQLT